MIRQNWLELTLMAFYVALLAKSAAIDRDAGRSLYWIGAILLMTGVLMMGKR